MKKFLAVIGLITILFSTLMCLGTEVNNIMQQILVTIRMVSGYVATYVIFRLLSVFVK
ncbi:hypothetical protein KNV77_gp039 [Klebsiella phage vB_KpnP_P184]|jgi:hypothetical protein|uniref:Uncharacterized protein n=1 Tax=Klebsiella phage vB_KpnP_P184 TaxID=2806547 RepID=A0A898KBZ5_9CAUD|nr:hypothetical protein KNV77_gp039 [Klebsiella phage vB_KpnP_P184]QSJ03661.1 hypothetical protein [Klebsiella phage vB_KpnP_P184]